MNRNQSATKVAVSRAPCSLAMRLPTASRPLRSARLSSVVALRAGYPRATSLRARITRKRSSIRSEVPRRMVLIFSEAANNSDEIKKELSLASRYRIPVIALRIEDVEPSDAFAYELSTRQWIDAFNGWDKSIDSLVSRIGQLSGAEPVAATAATPAIRRPASWSLRRIAIARRRLASAGAGRRVPGGFDLSGRRRTA